MSDEIREACAILSGRLRNDAESAAERALWETLSRSDFRLVPGQYSSRDREVVRAVQQRLAEDFLHAERRANPASAS